MLELAKLIHEAIGIENPKMFIGVFALVGLLGFGTIGWLVDKGYRAKLRQESETKQNITPIGTQQAPQNVTYGSGSPVMPNNTGTVNITVEQPKNESSPIKKESKKNEKRPEPGKNP
jgi:hypothetical protein